MAWADHEPQHPDRPTWCVWCGEFDPTMDRCPCGVPRDGKPRYDFSDPDNYARQARAFLGPPAGPEGGE